MLSLTTDPMSIEKVHYLDVCKHVKSFLSLDISVNGTGWSEWYDGKLNQGRLKISDDGDCEEDESKRLLMRRSNFHDFIKELVAGKTYEFIAIEDVIGGVNFTTTRNLTQLNTIVDDMMLRGEIPESEIVRIDNTKWKKYLRVLAQDSIGIKGANDKEEVVFILNSLGFNLEATHKNQDIYDSLGMALGIIANRFLHMENVKKRKLHEDILKGYQIEQASGKHEAEQLALKLAAKKARSIFYLLPDEKGRDLAAKFRNLVRRVGDSGVYCVELPSEQIGVVALLKNLTLPCENTYLVVTRK